MLTLNLGDLRRSSQPNLFRKTLRKIDCKKRLLRELHTCLCPRV